MLTMTLITIASVHSGSGGDGMVHISGAGNHGTAPERMCSYQHYDVNYTIRSQYNIPVF
jgi:hypothetical protein